MIILMLILNYNDYIINLRFIIMDLLVDNFYFLIICN